MMVLDNDGNTGGPERVGMQFTITAGKNYTAVQFIKKRNLFNFGNGYFGTTAVLVQQEQMFQIYKDF